MPPSDVVREPQITVLARPHFADPVHLPVHRVGDSTDGERLAEFAGRVCSMSRENPAGRSTREYLEHRLKQGHGEVLEHATYSLLLEGISRSLAHELMHHRAGLACSQLSPRHVNDVHAAFVIPPAVIGDAALESTWLMQVTAARESYRSMVDALMGRFGWVDDKVQRRALARDAAFGVLPNCVETKLVVTGNAREWRAILERGAVATAELEMRRLAIAVLHVMQQEAPAFFSDFEIYRAADRRDAAKVVSRNG